MTDDPKRLSALWQALSGEPPSSNDDPLAGIGLGLGASERARELAFKGLVSELGHQFDALMEEFKPKRGNPGVDVSIDVRRAETLLSLHKNIAKRRMKTRALIELARQVEDILIREGELDRDARLFGPTTETSTLEKSASAGLKSLGLSARTFGTIPAK